jgi:mono/diheme cytochrome c family protein
MVMPANFGDRLTYQQLADLIAYLRSQDQPIQ